ncbi:hypothetical protein DJICPGNB_07985 [Escherichia coli]|nr:hypothetical protein DJICPGNB_07985 [Escherichia coli]
MKRFFLSANKPVFLLLFSALTMITGSHIEIIREMKMSAIQGIEGDNKQTTGDERIVQESPLQPTILPGS